MTTQPADENILALERPNPALWKYYVIHALLIGPELLVSLPYLYFRYYTLRYRFDAEGIQMQRRLGQLKDSGLGNHEETAAQCAPGISSNLVAALREVYAEAGALREAAARWVETIF